MTNSFTLINDIIRDYFQYRCLISISRTFDHELLKLPFEQSRSDYIIERLTVYIHQYDINNLIDYWTQIEQQLLLTLLVDSQQLKNIFTKIRINLYRCYLIHAIQSSKIGKIKEFYDCLTKYFQQINQWTKEWFALPFLQNPEENLLFQVYFSKQWTNLFWTSLQNFLTLAFYRVTLSQIYSIEEDNSQSFKNISSLQSAIEKSAHDESSKRRTDRIFDNKQAYLAEHQYQSKLTILSKLKSKFSTNIEQNQTTEFHTE